MTPVAGRRGPKNKRKQVRANVDRRQQTLPPPSIVVSYTPPFAVLLNSEKLKKAVVGLEDKIQERSRRRGRFCSNHFSCWKVPKAWQGLHFALLQKRGIMFQQRGHLPKKTFQQGISDSHSLLEFSDKIPKRSLVRKVENPKMPQNVPDKF